MNLIGEKVVKARKAKGFTQEYLAELAKVNLRTIQRIEKNKTNAREHTLGLICDALQIEKHELLVAKKHILKNKMSVIIVNGFFLILLNLIFMGIIGFLTLDSNANANSRLGGFLFKFFYSLSYSDLNRKNESIRKVVQIWNWLYSLHNSAVYNTRT